MRWIRRDSAVILALKLPAIYRSYINECPSCEIEILSNVRLVRKIQPLIGCVPVSLHVMCLHVAAHNAIFRLAVACSLQTSKLHCLCCETQQVKGILILNNEEVVVGLAFVKLLQLIKCLSYGTAAYIC